MAISAIDGDPRTHWHTSFSPKFSQHPHELVIDLGQAETRFAGFRYLARQDGGWNGAVKDCEFFVSDRPDEFRRAGSQRPRFGKSKRPQEVLCEPATARTLSSAMRVLSEVNGGPWASIAEFGVVGE